MHTSATTIRSAERDLDRDTSMRVDAPFSCDGIVALLTVSKTVVCGDLHAHSRELWRAAD